MSKSKREEAAASDEGYEFKLPDFDEKAFVRREVLGARAAFVALGLGALGGALAAVLWLLMHGQNWVLGWLPILAAVLAFRPLLVAMKYPEDVTSVRATFGSLFMILFTGLAVWILGVNL